jgi:hypothetical protein
VRARGVAEVFLCCGSNRAILVLNGLFPCETLGALVRQSNQLSILSYGEETHRLATAYIVTG